MTLLEHPVTTPSGVRSLGAALDGLAGPGALLLVATGDLRSAGSALRREVRARDWVGRAGGELAVVVATRPADLDAVADRVLSVVERATGVPAAAGVCLVDPALPAAELVRRARAGLQVAWACGGSRAVRHP